MFPGVVNVLVNLKSEIVGTAKANVRNRIIKLEYSPSVPAQCLIDILRYTGCPAFIYFADARAKLPDISVR